MILTGITETWWDNSHDLSIVMDKHMFFRKDRLGRLRGRVALCERAAGMHRQLLWDGSGDSAELKGQDTQADQHGCCSGVPQGSWGLQG